MITNGYIKLFRKLKIDEWYQDGNTIRLFIHCLLSANYEEKKWQGKIIPIGSFITSLNSLVAELGISKQILRTSLNRLKSTQKITYTSTHKYTMINVVNWQLYQGSDDVANTVNNTVSNIQLTQYQHSDNTNVINKEEKNKRIKENVLDKSNTKRKLETDTKVKTYFQKPTIEEIKKYCDERNNKVDPEAFWHFYESKGWKVGNVSMKSWKSAIITWEKGNKNNSNKGGRPDAKPDWLDEYVKENGGK